MGWANYSIEIWLTLFENITETDLAKIINLLFFLAFRHSNFQQCPLCAKLKQVLKQPCWGVCCCCCIWLLTVAVGATECWNLNHYMETNWSSSFDPCLPLFSCWLSPFLVFVVAGRFRLNIFLHYFPAHSTIVSTYCSLQNNSMELEQKRVIWLSLCLFFLLVCLLT